jgi:hypothetical protein
VILQTGGSAIIGANSALSFFTSATWSAAARDDAAVNAHVAPPATGVDQTLTAA